MARTKSVKTAKSKFSTTPARVGSLGQTAPAQVGSLGQTAPAQVGSLGQTSPAQVGALAGLQTPQHVPQLPGTAPMPNNVNNQQAIAQNTQQPAVQKPRRTAKVKSAKAKNTVAQAASSQPSPTAPMQEASGEKPTFNFFFAGKTPF